MDQENFSDKRRYKRRKLDSAAVVLSAGNHRFERACEISEGGMLLQVQRSLKKGSILEVQIILPNKRFVAAHAEVIYEFMVEGKLYLGVRFVKILPASQGYIKDFVEHYS